jgi:hypothetical protein
VRALSRLSSPFALPPELGAEAGLNRAELLQLVEALGFRPVPPAEGSAAALFARPERRPYQRPDVAERKRRAMSGPATASPFSVLARLKAAT